jgi:hypothetical protein
LRRLAGLVAFGGRLAANVACQIESDALLIRLPYGAVPNEPLRPLVDVPQLAAVTLYECQSEAVFCFGQVQAAGFGEAGNGSGSMWISAMAVPSGEFFVCD